jgi:hypothetical protein
MPKGRLDRSIAPLAIALAAVALLCVRPAAAAAPAAAAPSETMNFGPYNASFLEGSVGLPRPLAEGAAPLAAGAPFSLSGWLRATRRQLGAVIVVAIGDVAGTAWRGLALVDGKLTLIAAPGATLAGGAPLEPGRWYAVAATYDGKTARLYLDGREIGAKVVATMRVSAHIELPPRTRAWVGPTSADPSPASRSRPRRSAPTPCRRRRTRGPISP